MGWRGEERRGAPVLRVRVEERRGDEVRGSPVLRVGERRGEGHQC